MRVLLFGATGLLGRELVLRAPAGVELVPVGRIELADSAAVRAAVRDTSPDLVVNAAAFTAVDAAEDAPERAIAVNATAPGELAGVCAAHGIRLVHFSSDYVFAGDGTQALDEADPMAPLGVYGRSKRDGELAIARAGADALVIRTQWLFGGDRPCFPRTMFDRATAGRPTRVVDDQFGRPTFAGDLADWTWSLARSETRGTIHAANAGVASWYDLAHRVFEHVGAAALLSPCATAEFPTRAARPAYSVLAIDRLVAIVGPVPDWCDALDRWLAEVDRPIP